jgi:hypothetical protein
MVPTPLNFQAWYSLPSLQTFLPTKLLENILYQKIKNARYPSLTVARLKTQTVYLQILMLNNALIFWELGQSTCFQTAGIPYLKLEAQLPAVKCLSKTARRGTFYPSQT